MSEQVYATRTESAAAAYDGLLPYSHRPRSVKAMYNAGTTIIFVAPHGVEVQPGFWYVQFPEGVDSVLDNETFTSLFEPVNGYATAAELSALNNQVQQYTAAINNQVHQYADATNNQIQRLQLLLQGAENVCTSLVNQMVALDKRLTALESLDPVSRDSFVNTLTDVRHTQRLLETRTGQVEDMLQVPGTGVLARLAALEAATPGQ